VPTLDWLGREAVKDHHRHVPVRLLEEDTDAGAGDREAGNLIVEGDNLEALRALLPRYAGRVDCVYIDPPYNTGNEGWVYNDAVNGPEVRAWLGRVVGGEADDLSRHDKWLTMMWPRLWLLKELLAETGSIWISLDDNEAHRARVVLDEVFGRRNFVANVVWQKKYAPANDATHLSASHDHVLVYARDKAKWKPNKLERADASVAAYKNHDGDDRGIWKSSDYTCNKSVEQRPNLYYPILNPAGVEVWPKRTAVWRYSPERHALNVEQGRVWWGEDGTNAVPAYKRFLSDVDSGVVAQTVWTWQEAGHTQDAARELQAILPGVRFDTPKPTSLIQRILQVATGPDALVLDAFAGSGTTAHAVLKQNALDGGRRRFVLVEILPEVAEEVTAARVRRAVEGYSVTGTVREVLHRETITMTTLRKADKTLARVAELQARHETRFDTVMAEVREGALVVVGERKETQHVDGLGSGFRYARLGAPLLDDAGALHPAVTYADLAAFAFLHATGGKAGTTLDGEAPLVGIHDDVAVYVLGTWGGDGAPAGVAGAPASGTLTRAALITLPPHDGPRVVYGEASLIPEDALAAAGVTFRQLPYCFAGNGT